MSKRLSTYFRSRRGRQLLYVAGDLLMSAIVWICFLLLRWVVEGDDRISGFWESIGAAVSFSRALIAYPAFCLLVYYLSGYYLQPQKRRPSSEFLTTFISAAVITLIAFFYIIIDDVVPDHYAYYNSLLMLFGLQFGLVYLMRIGISFFTRAYRYRPRTYTLQLSDAESGQISLPPSTERVIIEVPDDASEQQLYRTIGKLYPLKVEIAFTARTYDLLMGRTSIQDFSEQPLISITANPMSDFQLTIKRSFDMLMSLLCLVLLSPLMAGIALAIKCTSPGSVLYSQERIGHYGRPFQILKFRTMRSNAENGKPMLTQDDDPRITKVGHWLRKYRLDELPQLWNILKGDMAIVGPRPERRYFIEQIAEKAPYYCLIYKIRPGLTSWGPIKVGYTDTIEKMIQRLNYDIAYMENMSIRHDLKILFYTIGVIIHGKGK